MSMDNAQLVTEFCNCWQKGDMDEILSYLATDVVYQNMPWKPVVGHIGVRQVLGPFLQGDNCALSKMEIIYSTSTGNVVMNERLETWDKGDVHLELPVMGVFELQDDKIARWRDYFDSKAMRPLIEALS